MVGVFGNLTAGPELRFTDGGDDRGFAVPTPLDVFPSIDANDLVLLRLWLLTELAQWRLDE
ncbi:hypothetical protein [Mycobacterium lepromatosis]|uniref:hypothetical protein n=1 Tax=Mycobacterium lepromatosis TaxID=480418 RepID=UPI0005F7C8C1|nr:hypothetical protein [Mycobacterium lepromatosis]